MFNTSNVLSPILVYLIFTVTTEWSLTPYFTDESIQETCLGVTAGKGWSFPGHRIPSSVCSLCFYIDSHMKKNPYKYFTVSINNSFQKIYSSFYVDSGDNGTNYITFSTHIISASGGVEPPLVIEKEKLINKKRTKHQFPALSLTKYRNSSKSPLFSFQCFWKYVNYTAELCGMEIEPSKMRSYSGERTTGTRW